MFKFILNKRYGITNPATPKKANKNATKVKIGTIFGYWLVLGEADPLVYPNGRRKRLIVCKCTACSETIEKVRYESLQQGLSTSCCLGKLRSQKSRTVHGFRKHPIRSVHRNMLDRCYNIKNKHYKYYGGRGISVCKEWRNDLKVFAEWALANGYEKGLQIDRENNSGIYEPNNCRFVTQKVQANNMSKNISVNYKNKQYTFMQFWEEFNENISYSTALHRYVKLKMSPMSSVVSPLRNKRY